MKKLFSLLLAAVMIFGMVATGIAGLDFDGIVINAKAANYAVGDIVEFGSYPQSEVTDSTLLSKLNAKTLKWISYDYYSGDGSGFGTSVPNDEMKYADVEYNGEKYRAVRFETYRAAYVTAPSGYGAKPQEANEYYANTLYWFKFEPLEWRVLNPETGLMMCESIIDSQAFVNAPFWHDDNGDGDFTASEIYGDSSCFYKHYDYPHSSLNSWLNDVFYNTAFSSTDKIKMQNYEYEYPEYSMGYAPDFVYNETLSEKVFLLSTEEVLNGDYGFNSIIELNVDDKARVAYATDYAKCQGFVNENDKGYWFLRSSYELSNGNAGAFAVAEDGGISASAPAQCTGIGVRPAIQLDLADENIYNLGEETYSFKNFGDSDSSDGHCFGMSVTSSAYYTGELDVTELGIESCSDLYSLNRTTKVQKPICYYQAIQGEYRNKSIVAGGMPFVSPYFNINSDWTEVVDYVKNHDYDNIGSLMVIDYSKYQGGHAMNFLYYSKVNGQDRIYVYDNNFPDIETYFYKDSSGKIKQYPKATLSNIDSIGLMDIEEYLKKAESFDVTRVIYAYEGEISINGVEGHLMFGETDGRPKYMYELPQSVNQIEIIPLVDNAEFTYFNEEYTFGAVSESTVGTLVLVKLGAETTDTIFEIRNGGSVDEKVDIPTPSTTTINYGDKIVLHANIEGELPAGYQIKWISSNNNFSMSVSADGKTCTISPEASGETVFTAVIVDENDKAVSSDEQTMTSKAGFFQKIIAFFKKLFGLTKTIPQSKMF